MNDTRNLHYFIFPSISLSHNDLLFDPFLIAFWFVFEHFFFLPNFFTFFFSYFLLFLHLFIRHFITFSIFFIPGISESNVLSFMGCVEQRAVEIISEYLRTTHFNRYARVRTSMETVFVLAFYTKLCSKNTKKSTLISDHLILQISFSWLCFTTLSLSHPTPTPHTLTFSLSLAPSLPTHTLSPSLPQSHAVKIWHCQSLSHLSKKNSHTHYAPSLSHTWSRVPDVPLARWQSAWSGRYKVNNKTNIKEWFQFEHSFFLSFLFILDVHFLFLFISFFFFVCISNHCHVFTYYYLYILLFTVMRIFILILSTSLRVTVDP